MKAGAIDFLTKPVHDSDLFEAITRAEEQDVTSGLNFTQNRRFEFS
jgi:FixJ family two-component response regulator